ncbi:amidohydrolase family protein [bacterium]|nr:amidohydrolase family protein [bacterium]
MSNYKISKDNSKIQESISFFDINGIIGIPVLSPETGELHHCKNTSELIKEMDSYGIDKALVYHRDAIFYSPSKGNKELCEEIKKYPDRLFGCWVLLPHETCEVPHPEELIREIKNNNIRAVRLFPHLQKFQLSSCYETFSILDKYNIPVILPEHQELPQICKKFKNTPFILMPPFGYLRDIYNLLSKFKNIYVAIGNEGTQNAVEEMCEYFGAERLLFGTMQHGLNVSSIHPASIMIINNANITLREKALIAGNNLKRIINNVKIKFSSSHIKGKKVTSIKKRFNESLSNSLIIDCHFHLGEYGTHYAPKSDVKSVFELIDTVGISRLCINFFRGGDYRKGNNIIADLVKKYPDKIIGFCRIDPNFAGNIVEVLHYYIEVLKMKGIKIHPRVDKFYAYDARLKPMWEIADKRRTVILSHTTLGEPYSDPEQFDDIAGKYPNVPIILGHSGNNVEGVKKSIPIAKKRKNIYLDTSGLGFKNENLLEYAVDQIGPDRILFGSDCTFIDFNLALGVIVYSKISNEDKRKILGLNAAKLFKI